MTIPPDEPGRQPDPATPAPPARQVGAAKKGGVLKQASDALVSPTLVSSNPFAAVSVAVGIIGLLFGAFGVISSIGVIVSLVGLVRSRRLARDGQPKTGLLQSIIGLVLSVASLLRWLPVFAAVLPPEWLHA